jgi:hypothetical protein
MMNASIAFLAFLFPPFLGALALTRPVASPNHLYMSDHDLTRRLGNASTMHRRCFIIAILLHTLLSSPCYVGPTAVPGPAPVSPRWLFWAVVAPGPAAGMAAQRVS